MSNCANDLAVIVSGGTIDPAFVSREIDRLCPTYIIGVDKGLEFLYANRIRPTHAVGDFDSIDPKILARYEAESDLVIEKHNPVKDATDTELAIRLAVRLRVRSLVLFGGTGSRIDHVLANIGCLKIALDAGIEAHITDPCNRISLIEKEKIKEKKEMYGDYFSLFPIGGPVRHLSIEGAAYPLTDHTLSPYESLCVSNEVQDDRLRIRMGEGLVLLIESKDHKTAVL